MTTFDYILFAVAIAVLVHQISLLIRARREIILPGKPPSRGAVAVILAVVLVVAVIRTENLARTWPVFVIVFVACLAIFAGGCGLSTNGMFGSGRYIPFAQAAYYEIDERGSQKVFRLSRLSRETHMILTPEMEEKVLEIMRDQGIPRYEEYTHKMAKRANTRMEAQKRKKKKKK